MRRTTAGIIPILNGHREPGVCPTATTLASTTVRAYTISVRFNGARHVFAKTYPMLGVQTRT
jgi:hypothetical protein